MAEAKVLDTAAYELYKTACSINDGASYINKYKKYTKLNTDNTRHKAQHGETMSLIDEPFVSVHMINIRQRCRAAYQPHENISIK